MVHGVHGKRELLPKAAAGRRKEQHYTATIALHVRYAAAVSLYRELATAINIRCRMLTHRQHGSRHRIAHAIPGHIAILLPRDIPSLSEMEKDGISVQGI